MNRALRQAMEHAGHSSDSLAQQVNVDPKTVNRWLSGKCIPHPQTRSAAADALGREIADIWPDTGRWKEPAWFRPWAEIESEATSLRWYESAVVPGLLQTEEYARAVLRSASVAPDVLEGLIEARQRRQRAVFARAIPPLTVFVIDEAALRRGCPEIMVPQLEHLATMCDKPNVMLSVLPLAAGLHPGQAGPFVLATLGGDDKCVGYLDDQAAGRITTDVAELWRTWDIVRSVALPRSQSRELIEARAWMR